VNLEFRIIASPLLHTSSGAINFICDSHPSRYNFETLEGMLRSVSEYRPTKAKRALFPEFGTIGVGSSAGKNV